MAENTLEEKVEERQQDAKSKSLFEKVEYVCKNLGIKVMDSDSWNIGLSRRLYTFRLDNLVMSYYKTEKVTYYVNQGYTDIVKDEEAKVEISENTTKILGIFPIKNWKTAYTESISAGVTSYIPGPWEEELTHLYYEAIGEQVKEKEAELIGVKDKFRR